ncbi:MAG: hypothetical protein H7175_21090 [Burkholderiales bacterium]|nr:hypothetical protein [Anaerolineae bacterium]
MSQWDDETRSNDGTETDLLPDYSDLSEERSSVNGGAFVPYWRRGRLGRVGCIVGLIFWGICLLLPLVAIALVIQSQIVIQHSDVPGHELRIWLVMEARERGIAISNASLHSGAGGDVSLVCVQTNVSFIFWQGSANPTGYCECYARPSEAGRYTPISTTQGDCPT